VSNSTALVQRPWKSWSILRDEGLSYRDYFEELALLLSLKMADRPKAQQSSEVGMRFEGSSPRSMQATWLDVITFVGTVAA